MTAGRSIVSKCAAICPLLAIGLVLATAGPGVASLTDDLAAYYHFDGSGVDSSGNGLNLNLVGEAGFAPGLIGQALGLSGNLNQYAQMSAGVDDSALNFGGGNFTIQAWVNFNQISSEQTLLEKFSGSGGPGWTLTTPGGDSFQFYASPTVVLNFSPPGGISTGVWHDVTVLRSGSTFDMFLDDALVATASGSGAIPPSPNPLLIGRRNAQDGRGFAVDGRIDEVAMWTRALSDAEIGTLYNNGHGIPLATSIWTSAVSGNWSDSTKWTGGVPNAVGAAAMISAPTNSPLTVTLDSPQTIGTLLLGSGNPSVGYTLSSSGSNTLTFSNSGNGAIITVNDGSHVINAPVVLADKLVVTTGGANAWTLAFGNSGSITDNGGGYSLTMNGAGGTLILSGSNTYTGGTTVGAGVLTFLNRAAQPASGKTTVTAGATLGLGVGPSANRYGSADLDNLFAGTMPNVKNDPNSYVGIDTTAGSLAYSYTGSTTRGLAKLGPNTLTMTGSNSYTGSTTVSGGTLQLGNGTISHDASLSTRGITNNAALVYDVFNSQTADYPISGIGNLTKAGPGTLTLSGVNNSYAGPTLLTSGTLAITSNTANSAGLPDSSLVISSNTTLNVSAANLGSVSLGSLADASGSPTGHNVLLGGNTLVTGLDNTSTGFSGAISGNGGSLIKQGTGTFTLSGVNIYSGGTTVNAGTLGLLNPGALPNSPSIRIAAGATLDAGAIGGLTLGANQFLSGGGTVNGNLTVTATGATISADAGSTLGVNGNTVLNAGTVLNFGIGNSFAQPGLNSTGNLVLGGATTVNFGPVGAVATGTYIVMTQGGIAGAGSLSLGTPTFRGESLDTSSGTAVQVTIGAGNSLTWVGGASNKWNVNTDTNWYNNTTGNPDNFYQMDTVTFDDSGAAANGGTVTLVGNLAPTGTAGYFSGTSPSAAVTVNVSAGKSYTFTGPGSIVGTTSLSVSGGGMLTIANTNSFGGVDSQGSPYGIVSIHQGEIHVSPGGVLTNNTSEIDVGDIPGQTGTLTMSSGTAFVPLGSEVYSGVNVGTNGGTGILTLTGNSLLDATPTNNARFNVIDIGLLQGSVGTVTVGGTSTLRANNGPFGNQGYIAVGSSGTGTLTIQDQGLVQTGNLILGESTINGIGGGAGTLYLNGGTLSVPFVQNDIGTTGNLYFNGGTLQATASSSDFLQSSGGGALNTYVQTGGAVIDSNRYNIAINLALLHDPSGPVLDGGLTKVGSGTLILSGSNTYTGGTTVNAGTLIVVSNTALPDGTSLTVGPGATFVFDPSLAGTPAAASSIATVPEPGTLMLLVAGLVVGFGVLRKRKGMGD